MPPPSLPKLALVLAPVLAFVPPFQDRTAPFPREGEYLGKEYCRDCHEDEAEAVEAGHHAPVVRDRELPGCETCHGPGKAHGEDEDNDPALITFPKALSPRAQIAVCGQCHRDQIEGHGGDPAGFLVAGKGCTSCHRVHVAIAPPAHPGVRFGTRVEASQEAAPVGAARCVSCHPLRDETLERSSHRHLRAAADPAGCETCHGHGSLHVRTKGLARLITRPDRARDGIATCRACHEDVDPRAYHWRDRHWPLLSKNLTCTTCHRVHEPRGAPPVRRTSGRPTSRPALRRLGGIDPDTGQPDHPVPERPATNRVCARCHAPAFPILRGTFHESLGDLDAPLQRGCGACHPGGLEHARRGGKAALVESMRGFDAERQRATCMQCHERHRALRHLRAGSHFRNGVGCLSCHSPAGTAGRTRAEAERRCTTCHREVESRFAMPTRHPVPEGRMGCSDCHEPHGARPRVRDLELRRRRCVKCHTQYRGPFVFAHQASRGDGCVVCHEPHGATNRRMLRQHTTQQNCLQCHADFPSFHDQTPGAVFTNCLNCHTRVHGSNHSRYLFR